MDLFYATRKRLGTEKSLWFRSESRNASLFPRPRPGVPLIILSSSTAPRSFSELPDLKFVNQQVYQHCIYPRVLLSLEDAAFSAKFLKMMHSMGTQNFASLWYHTEASVFFLPSICIRPFLVSILAHSVLPSPSLSSTPSLSGWPLSSPP